MFRSILSACALATGLVAFVSSTMAASPPIEFDVPATLAVAEVTSPDLVAAGEGEKLIALRLPVSIYISPLRSIEVDDIVISLDSPSPDFRVVDFLPKTTLDTHFAGPVAIDKKVDRQLGIEFDASGICRSLTGMALTGKIGDTEHSGVQFQLVPPHEVVAASGTIHRGRGAYFKFRASSTRTLEGTQELLIVASVPKAWRGDLARVRCTAGGVEREPLSLTDEPESLAQRDFLIGLYAEGDLQAQRLAEQFAQSEQSLREAAAQHYQTGANPPAKLLQRFGLSSPAAAPKWLHAWLYGRANQEHADRFPAPIRPAAQQYASARAELHQLSGKETPHAVAKPSME